jgi:hypothetical protein
VEVGDIAEVYQRITDSLTNGQLEQVPLPDCSIDLDVTKSSLRVIEYNGLAESDKCLFTKEVFCSSNEVVHFSDISF